MRKFFISLGLLLLFSILIMVSACGEGFTVYYHEGMNTPAEEIKTQIEYGVPTPTLTIEQLGYDETERAFRGWAVFRTVDQKWRLQSLTNETNIPWMAIDETGLPEDYTYYLYSNGGSLSATAESGEVHLYAQWIEDASFEVVYHETETSEPSEQKTRIPYGISTATLTVSELGFQKFGYAFNGWKVFREIDKKWKLIGPTGNEVWMEVDNGILPEGYYFAVWNGGIRLAKTAQSGQIHFYATWVETTFDVTNEIFGADGTDEEDDTYSIQKALNMAKSANGTITVQIPAGTYYLDSALVIYSNTSLILSDQTILRRTNDANLMLVSGSKTGLIEGGYNQIENITISGGIWDGNAVSGSNCKNLIYLFHANDVSISGLHMIRCCGDHYIELAGVRDARITACSFSQFVFCNNGFSQTGEMLSESGSNSESGGKGAFSSEAIQLDFTSQNSSSGAAPFDGTVCSDILISDCFFSDCLCGVGNHHTERVSNNIRIINNTFVNMHNTCINLYAVNNAEIKNNQYSNIYRFVYAMNSSGTINIESNVLADGDNDESDGSWITLDNTDGTIASNNMADRFFYGIQVISSSNTQVIGNIIANSTNRGIAIVGSSDIEVTGNSIINTTNYGIAVHNSSKILLSENKITYCLGSGLNIYSQNEDIAILNNQIDSINDRGISFGKSSGRIEENTITNCGSYNIFTFELCSGIIQNNTYDLPYGVRNIGGMDREENFLLGADHEATGFTVYYHLDEQSVPASITTEITYGMTTKTETYEALGFYKIGQKFKGWKVYRNDTKTYRCRTSDGSEVWSDAVPENGEYVLFNSGVGLGKTVESGVELHLYAQWESVFMLPSNLTEIQAEAFMNNDQITSIIVGNKVVRIGSKAFANMETLEIILIPESVLIISEDTFSGSSPIIRCKKNSVAEEFADAHDMKKEIIP